MLNALQPKPIAYKSPALDLYPIVHLPLGSAFTIGKGIYRWEVHLPLGSAFTVGK